MAKGSGPPPKGWAQWFCQELFCCRIRRPWDSSQSGECPRHNPQCESLSQRTLGWESAVGHEAGLPSAVQAGLPLPASPGPAQPHLP